MISFSPEDLAFWVTDPKVEEGLVDGLKESNEANNRKVDRKWRSEDSFAVPEMNRRSHVFV